MWKQNSRRLVSYAFYEFSGHLDVNSGNVHGLKTQTFKAIHEKKYKMKENYGQKGKTGSL